MTTTMTKREDSAALNGEEYHLSFAEKDDDDAGEGPKVTGSYLDSLAGSGPPSYEFYSDTYGDADGDVPDPYRGVPSNPLGGYQPPGLVRQDQQETYVNGSSPPDSFASFVNGPGAGGESKTTTKSEEKDPNSASPFDSFVGGNAKAEGKKTGARDTPSHDSFASFVSAGATSEEKDPNNNIPSFDSFASSPKSVTTAAKSVEEKKKDAPNAPSYDSFASFVSAGATSEEKDPNNNIPSFDSFTSSPRSVATAAKSAEQEEKKDVPKAPFDDSFASFVSAGANSEEKDPNNFSSFDGFVGSGSLESEESKVEDAPAQGKETFAYESDSTFVAPADQHYHAPSSDTVIDLVIEEEEQEQDIREVPPLETYVSQSAGSDEVEKGTEATPFEDGPAEILGAGTEVEEPGHEPSFDGILSTVAKIEEDDAGMIANGDGRATILGAGIGGDRPNGDSVFDGGFLSAGVKYGDEVKEKGGRDAPHYLYDGTSSGIFGGGATFEKKDDAGENVAADGEREDQDSPVGESADAKSENDDAKSEGRDPDSVPWFDRANPSDSGTDKSEETKHDGESSSRWYD